MSKVKTIGRLGVASGLAALILLLATPAAVLGAAEDAGRVPLLASVVVRREKLLLSDFLPGDAPEPLRVRAAQVMLGLLPWPGADWKEDRAALQSQLDPELLRQLRLPAQMRAYRPCFRITAEQVRSALESALQARGIQASLPDLKIGATPKVDSPDLKLKVLDVSRDVPHHTWNARVVLADAPGAVPFWVTASEGESLAALRAGQDSRPARILPARPLLRSGQHAVLQLNDPGFHITLPVVCLENGFPGKEMRVRDEVNGRVHVALVGDDGQLQGLGLQKQGPEQR